MSSYVLKLGGAAIGIFMLGVLAVVIFDKIWFQVGLGAAIVVICGILLLIAWRSDKKDKAKRAGLEELPRV
jgi:hypothetical protein